ncbi:hypothetical protein Tco_0952813 [Tanacetum coccineum]|uniref:Reverse transcriptase domain-containing protein n=1 Tax=Tanacetum coccineum TaxID=301880 RepID=A0ABQ5E0Y1_9ASTR
MLCLTEPCGRGRILVVHSKRCDTRDRISMISGKIEHRSVINTELKIPWDNPTIKPNMAQLGLGVKPGTRLTRFLLCAVIKGLFPLSEGLSASRSVQWDIASTLVRIRQISQENRQKRANTDTRTEECARAGSQSQKSKSKGKYKLKGGKDNSMALVQDGRDKIVISRLLLVNQARKCHVEERKAQGLMKFTLSVLSKEAQSSNHTDATLAIRCMRTRSQARNRNRRQQQITPVIVEEPEFPMADNRTMAQMLQAPIEGYEDAIVVPLINANNFELKQTLINLVQSNQFTGRQDPHNHLRFFNKVTSTFRHPEVPNTSIKLLLFPFSLEGLLRQCPHHGFSELHQLDTFYNSLNTNDQDALDSAAGGNFLDKMPRDGLAIIESKPRFVIQEVVQLNQE